MSRNVDGQYIPRSSLYSSRFFPYARSFDRNFKTFVDAAVVVGGLAYNAYTGKRLYNEVFEPKFETFEERMARSDMVPRKKARVTRGYTGGALTDINPQYVATVRNHKSKFGRKKRLTLAKVNREVQAEYYNVISRFHMFSNNGFQNGLGAQQLTYRLPKEADPANTAVTMPFQIFDVTSLPCAQLPSTINPGWPVRGYQLCCSNRVATSAGQEFNKFGWVPLKYAQNSAAHMLDQYTNNCDEYNVAVAVEQTGAATNEVSARFSTASGDETYAPYAEGFTHVWSDINLVLYPQESLPVKWHVALISFPDSLLLGNDAQTAGAQAALETAGPPGYALAPSGVSPYVPTCFRYLTGYDATRTTQNNSENNLDNRWQKFFSGKLNNPINRDISAAGRMNPADNGLPFKIIKHESFLQPARDNVAFGGNAQRLIKKLFYRRDWNFGPSKVIPQSEQGDAINKFDTIQVHREQGAILNSSPFPTASERVYLAMWCEHFKAGDSQGLITAQEDQKQYPVNATLPSFDLVCRMKHKISTTQNTYPLTITKPSS